MPTTVFFATNRTLTGPPEDVASYSDDIQSLADPTGLIYGTAFIDGIDIASNTAGVVSSIQNTNVGDFLPSVSDDLSQAGRNLLLFIHGFDNNFSDALTQGAFNREWMALAGAAVADTTVIAFSWPSLGDIFGFPVPQSDYLRDQRIAASSGFHAMTFFSRLQPILAAARARGNRTFLLAHSMGNLVLENAVENWFLHGNGDGLLFDVAISAAGDCPSNAFDQPLPARLSGLPRLAKQIALYYSHDDLVLKFSDVVNLGTQRLGQAGPNNSADAALFPPAQYRIVDATAFRDFAYDALSSHQYYRCSPLARIDIASNMV